MSKLTIRQKRFVEELPNSKTAKQAAFRSGYAVNSAKVSASRNITNVNVQKEIKKVLDNSGLNDDKLAEKLRVAIDSGLGKKSTNSDALRGLEMSFRLRDRFPTQKRLEARLDIKADLMKKSAKDLKEHLLSLREEEERFIKYLK
jgi:phage terminase small subunit